MEAKLKLSSNQWAICIADNGQVFPYAGDRMPEETIDIRYDSMVLIGHFSPDFIGGLAHCLRRTISRWSDLASAIGVSMEEAKRFLVEWRPEDAKRLDGLLNEEAVQLAEFTGMSVQQAEDYIRFMEQPEDEPEPDEMTEFIGIALQESDYRLRFMEEPESEADEPTRGRPVEAAGSLYMDGLA